MLLQNYIKMKNKEKCNNLSLIEFISDSHILILFLFFLISFEKKYSKTSIITNNIKMIINTNNLKK